MVIDQFEEIFTLCNDEGARRLLIDNVLYATNIAGGRTIVVLTVRADFYGQCASYPGLRAAFSDHQSLIGPLREEEFRETIEAPTRLAGGELEPGLLELLLTDMNTFARIGAVVNLKVEDHYPSGKRFLLRFKEKGGKEKELPRPPQLGRAPRSVPESNGLRKRAGSSPFPGRHRKDWQVIAPAAGAH
jgi:integrase